MTIGKQLQCPKCGGNMVQGFVPDRTHQIAFVEEWVCGQPRKSFWRHTKAPLNQGIPIAAFRCEKCGFVEFYADARFAAE